MEELEIKYVPKKLGRKFIACLIVIMIIFLMFILSKIININTEKLEVACKWVTLSGLGYYGSNAVIAGVSQVTNVIRRKNGG